MSQRLSSGHQRTLTRRGLVVSLAASFVLPGSARAVEYPLIRPSEPFRFPKPLPDVVDQVIPKNGVPTTVVFGDSIEKLVAAGVLDIEKFRKTETNVPDWVDRLFAGSSNDPIVFREETSPYLVNLLWPLGLANRASFNDKSPIRTPGIPGFASTGGWTLGRERNGYVYFNKVEAVRMTDQQEALVLDVAMNTFRPCCDNSTFFQDCNHGSALLGLLELAAAQGIPKEGLYRLALTANSFWFPDQYAKTALLFAYFDRRPWSEWEPRTILGRNFSSLTGWEKNVSDRLARDNIELPGQLKGSQRC